MIPLAVPGLCVTVTSPALVANNYDPKLVQELLRHSRISGPLSTSTPKPVRAYLLKEDFQRFWDYNSPSWAGRYLDFWCQQTMRSRIDPMKKIAKTLRAHRELILNYFKAKKQFSSAWLRASTIKSKSL